MLKLHGLLISVGHYTKEENKGLELDKIEIH